MINHSVSVLSFSVVSNDPNVYQLLVHAQTRKCKVIDIHLGTLFVTCIQLVPQVRWKIQREDTSLQYLTDSIPLDTNFFRIQ